MSKLYRNKLSIVAVVAALLAILVACAVPVAPAAPANSGAAASAGTGQKIKITFWAHDFEPRVPLDKKYIAEFMKANPNVDVDYEVIPGDYDTKLRTALAAGTGPDVFAQWNGDIGTFYAEKTIVPVNAEALGYGSQKEITDQYVSPDNTLQGATFDGQLYGIPNEVSIYACYANNDMFKAAGLDPVKDFPKTWEDMLDVAQKLTKRDASGKLTQQGFDFDWDSSVYMLLEYGAMVHQLGGDELKPDSPENQKVMQYWVDWVNKYNLGGAAYDTNQLDDFLAKKVAIKCGLGSWARPQIVEAGIPYTVNPVPIWADAKNQNHFDIYAYFHMVNAHSAPEVQEAAWKLIWSLDSHPADYLKAAGLLQPQKVLVDSPEYKDTPDIDVYLNEMTTSQYSPRIAAFNEVADILMKARDKAVVEKTPVQEVLQDAQTQIDKVMADTAK